MGVPFFTEIYSPRRSDWPVIYAIRRPAKAKYVGDYLYDETTATGETVRCYSYRDAKMEDRIIVRFEDGTLLVMRFEARRYEISAAPQ